MAALPVVHFCQFHPKDQDIRVVGSELDGGTSLSGISQPTQVDGGGYWMADISNMAFGGRSDARRQETLAWRACNSLFSGGGRAVVPFCDRWNQPVGPFHSVPHDDDTSFDDGALYGSPGASASVLNVVNGETDGLNCTILDIAIVSEKPLIAGERFTHVHATWLDRCYEIFSLTPITGGWRINIQPGIRGGIAVGDPLDFDNPRCVMRRVSAPTNAINMGIFGSASIQLAEDMRQPS